MQSVYLLVRSLSVSQWEPQNQLITNRHRGLTPVICGGDAVEPVPAGLFPGLQAQRPAAGRLLLNKYQCQMCILREIARLGYRGDRLPVRKWTRREGYVDTILALV